MLLCDERDVSLVSSESARPPARLPGSGSVRLRKRDDSQSGMAEVVVSVNSLFEGQCVQGISKSFTGESRALQGTSLSSRLGLYCRQLRHTSSRVSTCAFRKEFGGFCAWLGMRTAPMRGCMRCMHATYLVLDANTTTQDHKEPWTTDETGTRLSLPL
jgi:hypothetical protein